MLLRYLQAHEISVAMRTKVKVIGDFRQPDGLRLAPAPAYISREQVVEAIRRIAAMVEASEHEQMELTSQRVT